VLLSVVKAAASAATPASPTALPQMASDVTVRFARNAFANA
jgi:hypothetical protein